MDSPIGNIQYDSSITLPLVTEIFPGIDGGGDVDEDDECSSELVVPVSFGVDDASNIESRFSGGAVNRDDDDADESAADGRADESGDKKSDGLKSVPR